jgi:hypothetical protein
LGPTALDPILSLVLFLLVIERPYLIKDLKSCEQPRVAGVETPGLLSRMESQVEKGLE